MERNHFNNSFKESTTTKPMKQANTNNKLKDPSWSSLDDDYLHGFSWPPRSYSCSFCDREFKSAQALGGHMNVHRRDRARLRLHSPSPSMDPRYSFLNPNPNPNPKPNFSSSSLVTTQISPTPSFYSSSTPSPFKRNFLEISGSFLEPLNPKIKNNQFFEVEGLIQEEEEEEDKVSKKSEFVSLELELGLVHNASKDLDLELRLGYA